MKSKELVRKERILEYLDNIKKQIEDIKSISVPSKDFFLERTNTIQTKAIKYSLACAIQDVIRVCVHIVSALSLWKARESESEAILALSDAGILPKEFAEKIKGRSAVKTGPSFHHRGTPAYPQTGRAR
jgi:uncharacterized protein YutE (UPF0331/DUF86 family)